MPEEEAIREAEILLRAIPEYRWLTAEGTQFFSTGDVAKAIGVAPQTVRQWCDSGVIPGAADFGKLGWRMPRSGLLVYFASIHNRNSAAG